jgi:acetyl esterase/lipase
MPLAAVLVSPWLDVTRTGDTEFTLEHAEPNYLYERHSKNAAGAFADPRDQKHPYASPVFGDFSKGFPPTLIQGGTKEILLSGFVRLYQALDTAGLTGIAIRRVHHANVCAWHAPTHSGGAQTRPRIAAATSGYLSNVSRPNSSNRRSNGPRWSPAAAT